MGKIRIIPLFFPVINEKQIKLSLKEIVNSCLNGLMESNYSIEKKAILNLNNLEEFNIKNNDHKLYLSFRWITVLGSLVLFNDFKIILKKLGLNIPNDITPIMESPAPDLYLFSCQKNVLDLITDLAMKIIQDEISYKTYTPTFNLNLDLEEEISKIQLIDGFYQPNDFILTFLSTWLAREHDQKNYKKYKYLKYQGRLPGDSILLTRKMIISILDLCPIKINESTIDYSLDILVDSGILKPKINYISNNGDISRGYIFGSEPVRENVIANGKANYLFKSVIDENNKIF